MGSLLAQGFVSIITGRLAFFWSMTTVLAFELLIASWSIVSVAQRVVSTG
jgi:uncharacterized membrane protein HdeD (DUF308 family)